MTSISPDCRIYDNVCIIKRANTTCRILSLDFDVKRLKWNQVCWLATKQWGGTEQFSFYHNFCTAQKNSRQGEQIYVNVSTDECWTKLLNKYHTRCKFVLRVSQVNQTKQLECILISWEHEGIKVPVIGWLLTVSVKIGLTNCNLLYGPWLAGSFAAC